MIRYIVIAVFSLVTFLFSADLLAKDNNKKNLEIVRLDAVSKVSSHNLSKRQIKEKNQLAKKTRNGSFRIEEVTSGQPLEKWTVEQMVATAP